MTVREVKEMILVTTGERKNCSELLKQYVLNEREFDCPTELTLDVIMGKWKAAIIRELGQGKKRYCELYKQLSNVTYKVLTAKLKELERDGVIRRKTYHVIPPKVEYELTKLGKTLLPVLECLGNWGSIFKK